MCHLWLPSQPCELEAKNRGKPGGRLQSRLRGPKNCNKTKNLRMKENLKGKPRKLKWEQMHLMSAFQVIFNRFHLVATLRFTWANILFWLTVLGPFPNWHWVREKNGCSWVKLQKCPFSTPTHQAIQEVCQRHLSKTNSLKCKQPKQSIHEGFNWIVWASHICFRLFRPTRFGFDSAIP